MPPNESPWPTAPRSVGSAPWTRPPAPSWGRRFSPRAFWSQVDPRATQRVLRRLFARFGLPEQLRVDNGMPWGSQGDLPTDLACWLAGLGVGVLPNPPRQPQRNGVIERYQDVGQSWGEPESCASAAELQRRLNTLDRWQRELDPTADGRPRWVVYPGLKHSGRRYDPAREAARWELRRAWEFVGSHLVRRQVDSQGKVSLYNRAYAVGVRWRGRTIWVGFDPEAGAWVFQDEQGHEIRRQAAAELSAKRIRAMEVTHRRRGCHAAKPHERTKAAQPTKR
jgi:hypothetical protein